MEDIIRVLHHNQGRVSMMYVCVLYTYKAMAQLKSTEHKTVTVNTYEGQWQQNLHRF